MLWSTFKLSMTVLINTIFTIGCVEQAEKDNEYTLSQKDCVACDRLTLFYEAKALVGKSIWYGLNDPSIVPPLLYFTDSTTYIAYSNDELFKRKEYVFINCQGGMKLQKLEHRLDDQPFHMENKMSFKDTSSLYYYTPMMLCSDTETMHQYVPDFETTEEWLQLVMHEYFHSFQFSHDKTISYLADNIRISADTLDNIYINNAWFRQEVKKENQLLLKAIETRNEDSLTWYIDEFNIHRANRRLKYQDASEFDLTSAENFWETIEGTARYVEYYMATYFTNISINDSLECDSLFHNFERYKLLDLENQEEFKQRTVIMPAYYYATGFNLCRLMDKLDFKYERELFTKPREGLYKVLVNTYSDSLASVTSDL